MSSRIDSDEDMPPQRAGNINDYTILKPIGKGKFATPSNKIIIAHLFLFKYYVYNHTIHHKQKYQLYRLNEEAVVTAATTSTP